MSAIMWHDVECGGYAEDLPLWRELAAAEAGPVLDVGAGAGRVALELARAGHDVTALDLDPGLLAALRRRARQAGVEIATVTADAHDFTLPRRVGLVLVPMQTIQLLPDRAGFFAAARRALVPGGRLAVAIATELEPYDGVPPLPTPDLARVDGWTYISQPIAIRVLDDHVLIERLRRLVGPNDERKAFDDVIRLQIVSPGRLAEEAAEHGLEAEELRHIPETPEHVASEVVVFRG